MVLKRHAVDGRPVEIGRACIGVAIRCQGLGAELIAQYQDDIRMRVEAWLRCMMSGRLSRVLLRHKRARRSERS